MGNRAPFKEIEEQYEYKTEKLAPGHNSLRSLGNGYAGSTSGTASRKEEPVGRHRRLAERNRRLIGLKGGQEYAQ
jgi:hypothetical protein